MSYISAPFQHLRKYHEMGNVILFVSANNVVIRGVAYFIILNFLEKLR